jgi:hypothetical protein
MGLGTFTAVHEDPLDRFMSSLPYDSDVVWLSPTARTFAGERAATAKRTVPLPPAETGDQPDLPGFSTEDVQRLEPQRVATPHRPERAADVAESPSRLVLAEKIGSFSVVQADPL